MKCSCWQRVQSSLEEVAVSEAAGGGGCDSRGVMGARLLQDMKVSAGKWPAAMEDGGPGIRQGQGAAEHWLQGDLWFHSGPAAWSCHAVKLQTGKPLHPISVKEASFQRVNPSLSSCIHCKWHLQRPLTEVSDPGSSQTVGEMLWVVWDRNVEDTNRACTPETPVMWPLKR